jgi:hypothetical protein
MAEPLPQANKKLRGTNDENGAPVAVPRAPVTEKRAPLGTIAEENDAQSAAPKHVAVEAATRRCLKCDACRKKSGVPCIAPVPVAPRAPAAALQHIATDHLNCSCLAKQRAVQRGPQVPQVALHQRQELRSAAGRDY